MKFLNKYTYALTILVLFSCNSENDPTPDPFERGVMIINEGQFQSGNGSLSFIDRNAQIQQTIFQTANDGLQLGDIVQSVALTSDRAYISVNNSNLLVMADATTLEWIQTKDDVVQPRYVLVNGGKGYLTQWAANSGQILEFDLETGQTIRSLDVGLGSDQFLIKDMKAFISNSWVNTVSVVDLGSFEKVGDIEVGLTPGGIIQDQGGNLWLMCVGDFFVEGDSELIRIDPDTQEISLRKSLGMDANGKIDTDENGLQLFFTADNEVYIQDLGVSQQQPELFVAVEEAVQLYGIGVDREGVVYVADHKNFAGNGAVFVLNEEGEQMASYPTGFGPNGFIFLP